MESYTPGNHSVKPAIQPPEKAQPPSNTRSASQNEDLEAGPRQMFFFSVPFPFFSFFCVFEKRAAAFLSVAVVGGTPLSNFPLFRFSTTAKYAKKKDPPSPPHPVEGAPKENKRRQNIKHKNVAGVKKGVSLDYA